MYRKVHGKQLNGTVNTLHDLEWDDKNGYLIISEYGMNWIKTARIKDDNNIMVSNTYLYELCFFGDNVYDEIFIKYEDINKIILKHCPSYSISNKGTIITDKTDKDKIIFCCESALDSFNDSIDLREYDSNFINRILIYKNYAKLLLTNVKTVFTDSLRNVEYICRYVPEWNGTVILEQRKDDVTPSLGEYILDMVKKSNTTLLTVHGYADKYGNIHQS